MTNVWEPTPIIIASVASIATFEIWKSYERNAPTLAELRSTIPGSEMHLSMRQALLDADLTIGTLALVVAGVFTIQTHDPSMLLLIAAVIGILSLWRHSILNAESR